MRGCRSGDCHEAGVKETNCCEGVVNGVETADGLADRDGIDGVNDDEDAADGLAERVGVGTAASVWQTTLILARWVRGLVVSSPRRPEGRLTKRLGPGGDTACMACKLDCCLVIPGMANRALWHT